MSKRYFINPFLLLRLIRDGEVTKAQNSFLKGNPPTGHPLRDAGHHIAVFEQLGLISRDETGNIEPTGLIHEFSETFGLSLTEMSAFSVSSVVVNPLFGKPEVTSAEQQIFVLMPFSPNLRPVYDDHIKKVARDLGIQVSRADDIFSNEAIIEEIWNAIYGATVLIADCTGRNPNVFYEIGIAHTLGKPVVLIAQDLNDVPFDLRHLRIVTYEYTPRGMTMFEEDLTKTLKRKLDRIHANERRHRELFERWTSGR